MRHNEKPFCGGVAKGTESKLTYRVTLVEDRDVKRIEEYGRCLGE
jgi:hypothetical protein